MSSRPSFRGGRAGARSRGRRSYSDSASGDGGDNARQFVTGDSHFGQVRDSNRSFRPRNNRGNFRNYPPSPSFNRMPPPPSYNRVPPPSSYNSVPPPPSHNFYPSPLQQFDQNQQFYRPPRPPFSLNQQFRPPWQHQQQFRPRPPKDLEYRNWEYANPGPPPQCERFTILSYNILADYLARDHWDKLYFHIPRHFLDWERRKRSIMFELGLWSADIMCLQEVDRFQDLKEELELRGYSGIWKMRTGDPVDGCAIFWHNSRFKLLYEESLEFCKLGLRDNVAQICVFESLDQCKNSGASALTSSAHAKKLVVCNIHVLFNPKRGEIKLGQIRVLLSKANAVSKLWDDAPLIVCGDFNSTPKSPLYNFITEQKLDLSELPRNEVSGQVSAEICLSRPSNPKYGAKHTENSAQAVPAFSSTMAINRSCPLDGQKPESPDNNSGNGPSMDSVSQSQCSVIKCHESNHSEGNNDKPKVESDFHGVDGCSDEIKSNTNICHEVFKESASLLSDEAASSVSLVQDKFNDLTLQDSCLKDSKFTEDRHIENEYPISSEIFYSSMKSSSSGSETMSNCNHCEFSFVAESSCNSISNPEYRGTSSLDISTELPCPNQSHHSLEVSAECSEDLLSPSAADEKDCASTSYGDNILCESTGSNFQLDEKMESLSFMEELKCTKEGESVGEEDINFLSELHGSSPIPLHSCQFEELDESIRECTSSDSQELQSPGEEIPRNTPAVVWESIAGEKSKYDPSAWTPVEIETATGSSDCIVMEHPLKLQSVYREVQDSSGTRDSIGEPAVTSYHRRFMGTVDYMWRSEGLQTARVLAPLPKHAMLWTKGFPTKKWGSDHIALVSELAFKTDNSSQNAEVL